MKKMKTILILIFVCFAILGQQSAQANAIFIEPSSLTVGIGDIFSLDIGISVDDAVNFIIIDLSYDPLILDFIVETDQNFLANNVQCIELPCNTNTVFNIIPDDGKIFIDSEFWNYGLNEIDLNSYAIGTGILASLQFKAIGLGTSPVSFEIATTLFGPEPGLVELIVEKTPGEVNVVPEPSTLLLLGSGLIASLGAARRFKKKA